MAVELREHEAKLAKKKKKKNLPQAPEDAVIDSMFPKKKEDEEPQKTYAHQRLIRINAFLSSRRASAYCAFLLWYVPSVDKFNKTLQKDEPLIHVLHPLLHNFLRDLLSRFMKTSALANVQNLKSVNYKDKKLQVG